MNRANAHLTQAESLFRLGLIKTAELPKWAAALLSDGIESNAILQLAICSGDETEEIYALFKKILEEGGCGNMSKTEALRHYAIHVSNLILAAEILPRDGARLIWQATISARERGFHDLDGFIYAASEMDDRPDDKAFFEKAIMDEAKRWSAY